MLIIPQSAARPEREKGKGGCTIFTPQLQQQQLILLSDNWKLVETPDYRPSTSASRHSTLHSRHEAHAHASHVASTQSVCLSLCLSLCPPVFELWFAAASLPTVCELSVKVLWLQQLRLPTNLPTSYTFFIALSASKDTILRFSFSRHFSTTLRLLSAFPMMMMCIVLANCQSNCYCCCCCCG